METGQVFVHSELLVGATSPLESCQTIFLISASFFLLRIRALTHSGLELLSTQGMKRLNSRTPRWTQRYTILVF
jgi:hypothetical protein